MKILIIGNGGREHALAWKISKSSLVSKIYCINGNGGTESIAKNIELSSNEEILNFVVENKIDLTIVGPENPLCEGIVDLFEENNLKIFGPSKKSAKLERSKEFTKEFLSRNKIPTAKYSSYTELDEALNGLSKFAYPLVIKADGLCKGKGVFICEDEKDAKEKLEDIFVGKIFGDEGSKVVLEEFLQGYEASLICLVSENNIIPLEVAKDYKRIGSGDTGENTGGVGCISPNPLLSKESEKELIDISKNIHSGLVNDGLVYNGVLFIGFMINEDGAKVLEFNVRFGDPETEVILPRLKSDLVEVILKTLDNTIANKDLEWSNKTCITTVVCSGGYPETYETNKVITGLEKLDGNIIVFHNGTKVEDNKILTNGGRVLSITALEENLEKAREKVYENIKKIEFEGMYCRDDIGKF